MGEKLQFTELDQYLFGQGTHYDIYRKLGAHPVKQGKKEGIEIGELRMLVKQIKKGRLTIEEAAEDAAMSVEEFRNVTDDMLKEG